MAILMSLRHVLCRNSSLWSITHTLSPPWILLWWEMVCFFFGKKSLPVRFVSSCREQDSERTISIVGYAHSPIIATTRSQPFNCVTFADLHSENCTPFRFLPCEVKAGAPNKMWLSNIHLSFLPLLCWCNMTVVKSSVLVEAAFIGNGQVLHPPYTFCFSIVIEIQHAVMYFLFLFTN